MFIFVKLLLYIRVQNTQILSYKHLMNRNSNNNVVDINDVLGDVDSSLSEGRSTKRIAQDVDGVLRYALLISSGLTFVLLCYVSYANWQLSIDNKEVSFLSVFVIFALAATSTILFYGYSICKRINAITRRR